MKNYQQSKEFDSFTLNSTKPVFLCTNHRPCKRINCCNACYLKRRDFFITSGLVFCKQWSLDCQLVISWSIPPGMSAWETLISSMQHLSKIMSARKVGKYIRVVSVSPEGNPHVHLLVNFETAKQIELLAKKKWLRKRYNSLITKLYNTEGILGYFYDVNYAYSMRDPDKIKRTKLISASRPFPCCFPVLEQAAHFELLESKLMDALPTTENIFSVLINWNKRETETSLKYEPNSTQ